MGLYDREYTQADFHSRSHDRPRMQFALPRIGPVVKWLLIINTAVFVASFLITPLDYFLNDWCSVYPVNIAAVLQLWRLITYQFLHWHLRHLLLNMLVLFFFGPMLERLWGGRKFLIFYLACGAAGGVLYPVLAFTGWLDVGPMKGASGAIMGMLAAGAILFPRMMVYVWGIIPVRLVVLAIVLAAVSILMLLRPDRYPNAGGEAAHLSGMVAGALFVLSQRWQTSLSLRIRKGLWRRKITAERDLQAQLDRILQKVHDSGIHSLTHAERRILRKATDAEQKRNRP